MWEEGTAGFFFFPFSASLSAVGSPRGGRSSSAASRGGPAGPFGRWGPSSLGGGAAPPCRLSAASRRLPALAPAPQRCFPERLLPPFTQPPPPQAAARCGAGGGWSLSLGRCRVRPCRKYPGRLWVSEGPGVVVWALSKSLIVPSNVQVRLWLHGRYGACAGADCCKLGNAFS